MIGNAVTSKRRQLGRFAPLLAAALLCAGCAREEPGRLAADPSRLAERISPREVPETAGGPGGTSASIANSGTSGGTAIASGAKIAANPEADAPAVGESEAAPQLHGPTSECCGQVAAGVQSGRKEAVAAPHGTERDTAVAAANPNESASKSKQTGASESNSDAQAAAQSSSSTDAASVPSAPAATSGAAAPSVSEAAAEPVKKRAFSIPVLNYHSIGVEPDNNAVLDPKKLDEQMAYLSKEGYTALTLRQFIDIWDGRLQVPDKAVLLTFDDGYTDNYTEAMPILQKYGYTATMFVSAGMTGQDGYFAEWEQIREMRDAGWDIQPHGMTHPYLNKLPEREQRYEIAESIKQLKEQTGIDAEVFCYPYGERNQTTLKLLEELNVRFAFTIDQGRTEPTQNPLLLKRIFVGGKESMATFQKKLKP